MSAKTDNRPDFQRMIKDSTKGLFDVVLVWKLDRFARNRYDNGATMKEIRDYLNNTGVTTVRGKAIDLNFVAAILHNRKFLGEYKYREIVIPNSIPAIVPQDLFDRVQDKLAKNKKTPARHKAEDDYLLTTKLFCGTCGAMMVGESGTSSTERKYHYCRWKIPLSIYTPWQTEWF